MRPDASDAELILKCKQNNSKCQEMLYKRYYAYAMGLSMRYLPSRDDALEVANDAFIKVFKSIGSFQEDAEFKPWLRRILVNTALDHKRKHSKHAWEDEVPETRQQTFYPSVLEKLSAADILNLLKSLPGIQQVIFNLYEIDGYSHKEIGNMLGIAESSSRTYLTRAKQTLQKLLHNELIKL